MFTACCDNNKKKALYYANTPSQDRHAQVVKMIGNILKYRNYYDTPPPPNKLFQIEHSIIE